MFGRYYKYKRLRKRRLTMKKSDYTEKAIELINKGMNGEDLSDLERMIIGSQVNVNDKINQRAQDRK